MSDVSQPRQWLCDISALWKRYCKYVTLCDGEQPTYRGRPQLNKMLAGMISGFLDYLAMTSNENSHKSAKKLFRELENSTRLETNPHDWRCGSCFQFCADRRIPNVQLQERIGRSWGRYLPDHWSSFSWLAACCSKWGITHNLLGTLPITSSPASFISIALVRVNGSIFSTSCALQLRITFFNSRRDLNMCGRFFVRPPLWRSTAASDSVQLLHSSSTKVEADSF